MPLVIRDMPDTKTTLVTGASSGIGRAITSMLLEQGHRVIGLARDFSKVPQQEDQLIRIEVDLSHLERLPDRLKTISDTYPGIQGVILCAGAGRFGSLEEFSWQQIRDLVDLNLTSQVFIARAFLPLMKQRGRGDLIFIGSEAALAGGRRGALYAATKFGVRGLAQSLRQECAGSGVRVCIVNPGMVKTGFFSRLSFTPGEEPDNYILPEDIAETVRYLLNVRQGTVIDEINLTPQKKVVRFRKPQPD